MSDASYQSVIGDLRSSLADARNLVKDADALGNRIREIQATTRSTVIAMHEAARAGGTSDTEAFAAALEVMMAECQSLMGQLSQAPTPSASIKPAAATQTSQASSQGKSKRGKITVRDNDPDEIKRLFNEDFEKDEGKSTKKGPKAVGSQGKRQRP